MNPAKTNLEAQFSLEREGTPIPEDPPFHILFMGDYSGRENLLNFTRAELPKAHPVEIDRDNFEDVMKKLNVSLRLDLQGDGTDFLILNFKELDDFHPDRIFQQISLFSDLRDLRERLLHPRSFENAAREVRSWQEDSNDVENTSPEKSEPKKNTTESSGNLLEDILSNKVADSDSYKTPVTDSPELKSFIRAIVRPHLITTDENEQANLIAYVDESISELMKKILHHPHFQALESAWRGLYFVVRRTETSRDLKLFLMDVSKNEATESLKSEKDLTDTGLYREIVTDTFQRMNGDIWALICGNYTFDMSVEDIATLIRLAKIGNITNAPFLSHLNPQMLGIRSIAEKPSSSEWNITEETSEGKLWTMLRTIPESGSLGFAIPRFLSRLPYGERTEPTEVFSFEEFGDDFEHKDYLWSNPSFACAMLLAQSFRSFGWEMGDRLYHDIEGLPIHLFEDDGGTKTKSCAEVNMTHQACDVLIEQGFMPLISFRDTDRVRLGAFQSIAFPSKSLRGRWS
jgi:type VI secretion system protein ImpC